MFVLTSAFCLLTSEFNTVVDVLPRTAEGQLWLSLRYSVVSCWMAR